MTALNFAHSTEGIIYGLGDRSLAEDLCSELIICVGGREGERPSQHEPRQDEGRLQPARSFL